MITEAIRRRQQELTERREPFVTATVVKTEKPTSAVPGDVALVPADGVLEGFVGGVCAQNSVRLYALQALARGEPTFGDSPTPFAPSGWCGDGVTVAPSSKSGHSIEVGIR